MMRIDVDDQDVVEAALMRLFARVCQKPRGVELFDADAAATVGDQVHELAPGISLVMARGEATKQCRAASIALGGFASAAMTHMSSPPGPALP